MDKSYWGVALATVSLVWQALGSSHAVAAPLCTKSVERTVSRGAEVVTYYAPSCLLTNYPSIGGITADERYAASEKWRDPFDANTAPSFTQSYGATTDTTAVGEQEITATLVPVLRQLPPPLTLAVYNAVGAAPYGVQRNFPGVQVITNLTFGNGLCTGNMFLPPFWGSGGAEPRMVLEHTGFAVSMNDTWRYGDLGVLIGLTTLSVANGSSGHAVLQLQCGRETIGVSETVRLAVGSFAKQVADTFGISLENVILRGMSRGGGMALRWAAKPPPYIKSIAFVESLVPLVDMTALTNPTTQMNRLASLAYGMDIALGIGTLHRTKDLGALGLNASTRSQAVLLALCGSANLTRARQACAYDALLASLSPTELTRLRRIPHEITIGLSDSFMPGENYFLLQKLCAVYGLACRFNVAVHGSHGANFSNEVGNFRTWASRVTLGQAIPRDTSTVFYVPGSRRIRPDGTTAFGLLVPAGRNTVPTTVVVPSTAVIGVPFDVEVLGHRAMLWRLVGKEGTLVRECTGSFGTPEVTCTSGMRVVHTGITADSFLIQVTGTRQSITWSVFESEVMGVWKPVTDTGYLSAACTPVPFVTNLRQSEYADPFWYFHFATSYPDLGLRSFAGTNQRIRTVGCTP